MRYQLLVPSGIGDFSWLWSKIVTSPHTFHIEYIGGTPDRMGAFLSLLPKEKILSYKPNEDYATKWDDKGELICFNRQHSTRPIFKAHTIAESHPHDLYFMENNSWLEAGNRIEEWNKEELPQTEYHYDILGKLIHPVRGNYFIVNFSSYGTKKAWGYYDVPISTEIVEFICKKTGWEAVFIGGTYDDYTADIYTALSKRGIKCKSFVGQTPSLIEVIGLLQQSRMYFGACSGLMVLTNNLYTPVCTYYPPFQIPPGRKLAGTWHDRSIPYLPLFWDGKENDLCEIEKFLKKIK